MAKMLTDEQKKEYVERGGYICPFCGSKDLDQDDADFGIGFIVATVHCYDCGEYWRDTYELTEIKEE